MEKLISKKPNQLAGDLGAESGGGQQQLQALQSDLDVGTSKEIRIAELYFGKPTEKKDLVNWIKEFRKMQQMHTLDEWLELEEQADFKTKYEAFLAENRSDNSFLSGTGQHSDDSADLKSDLDSKSQPLSSKSNKPDLMLVRFKEMAAVSKSPEVV